MNDLSLIQEVTADIIEKHDISLPVIMDQLAFRMASSGLLRGCRCQLNPDTKFMWPNSIYM
jgi:hypothetical protein